MQKTDTKQKILDAALDLFSVQGYEATSISQIADAVDIRKASLYSHFKSKQEILDALIETVLEEYNRHSVFANADWDVLRYFTGMIRFFIRSGKLVADDPQLAAAQLCLPINVWINLCDREPNREPEIMELIERYVRRFFDQASSKIS